MFLWSLLLALHWADQLPTECQPLALSHIASSPHYSAHLQTLPITRIGDTVCPVKTAGTSWSGGRS